MNMLIIIEYTIPYAKLKQSLLFQRDGIYGIDDTLQIDALMF